MTADPATTLAAHEYVRSWRGGDGYPHEACTGCNWTHSACSPSDARVVHARHVLSVLSATHAIIELPEDDSLIASYDMTVALPRNGKPRFEPIGIDADDATWFISIDEARRRATAYLSAAQWAETGAARRAEEAGQ